MCGHFLGLFHERVCVAVWVGGWMGGWMGGRVCACVCVWVGGWVQGRIKRELPHLTFLKSCDDWDDEDFEDRE